MLRLLKQYLVSPTHRWWVDHVWRPAWNKALALVYGIPAACLAVLSYADQLMSDDRVQQLLDKLHIPEGVLTTIAALALLHYIADSHNNA